MIKKVLIAEDHESANISVQVTLEDLRIPPADYVYYCDDALARIRTAQYKNISYDLLITDLSFDDDGRPQDIKDGEALIIAAREVQPDLKILVFSGRGSLVVVDRLYEKLMIDGYVSKARHDTKELKLAIESISKGQRYYPRHLQDKIKQKNTYQFTELDYAIVTLLAKGTSQKDIPAHLQKQNIQPNGLSSVEKRLNLIKEAFECTKNEQLIAKCKDMGLI